ncbi:hypothetical protein RJ639_024466 [Escallonia herrerae]|uniref:Peptidase A1 domain-containing protein n=1 Tax=Escallonia herrerae TaxID=1293975 RepID=A0AA89ADJ3_9ASTE|nr:hypothetical protein RJ639_024466 [Escallonia herrerae]
MDIAIFLVQAKLLAVTAFLLTTTISTSEDTTVATPHRLVTKLIYRDSILLPFYNASATISDRANQAMESSVARLAYLKASNDIRGGVIASNRGIMFFVRMSIGEPPVPQLVAMDTASSLLRVHCFPCNHCTSDNPIFDPLKSSTYSPSCILSSGDCDHTQNECTYMIQYADSRNSTGNYGLEKLMFDVVFGCGHGSYLQMQQSSGVLGLGGKTTSLATRLGSRFSYCIGNISDPHYVHNQLSLGEAAVIQCYSMPLNVCNNFYHLILEGISVGTKRLGIDPRIFRRTQAGRGGVIIDSGSSWSYLVRGAFEPLSSEVQKLVDRNLKRLRIGDHPEWLCYKGIVTQDLVGFPGVTFHFARGANLVLDVENMFHTMGNRRFCMVVGLADGFIPRDMSLLGVYAQQYLNVGYDLSARTLSFERVDCQFLED